MKRLLLIDGDILIYRAAFIAEQAVDWGGGQFTLSANQASAEGDLVSRVQALMVDLEADDFLFALTHADNFRKVIYPDYKANRTMIRKPMLLSPLKAFAHRNWGAKVYERPQLEGDDCLGILATKTMPHQQGGPMERIIVSTDKDFKSIPGKHYNFTKPDEGIIDYDVKTANYYHMMQTLTGDITDNYPGCPGVGPVKAGKVLGLAASPRVMWEKVVGAFKKAGKDSTYALMMAQVARICRAEDYDWSKKQPIPWRAPR